MWWCTNGWMVWGLHRTSSAVHQGLSPSFWWFATRHSWSRPRNSSTAQCHSSTFQVPAQRVGTFYRFCRELAWSPSIVDMNSWRRYSSFLQPAFTSQVSWGSMWEPHGKSIRSFMTVWFLFYEQLLHSHVSVCGHVNLKDTLLICWLLCLQYCSLAPR